MYNERCKALNMKSANALKDPYGPAVAVSLMTVVVLFNSHIAIRNHFAH